MSDAPFRDARGKLALFEAIEGAMLPPVDPALVSTRRSAGMSPSAASAVVEDPVSGLSVVLNKCMRATYYKMMGFAPDPSIPDARLQRIMQVGELIDRTFVTEPLKRAGLYLADELSFFDPDNLISGRLDDMSYLPGTLDKCGIEVKSFSPFMKVPFIEAGRGYSHTEPRYNDLPQVMSYMQWFLQFGVKYWSVYYCTRDMHSNMFMFEWANLPEGATRPPDEAYLTCHAQDRTFDMPWLTWGHIRQRYAALRHALKTQTIPPRDFQLEYSNRQLLDMCKWAGKGSQLVSMSVTDSRKVQSRFRAEERKHKTGDPEKHDQYIQKGDFACNYCDFQKRCWSGLGGNTTPEVPPGGFDVKPPVPPAERKPVARTGGDML